MIGAMFVGLILILCLAYFIFVKAWKQDVMALKIIGFVLVGLLLLTALCAPVCMMVRCRNGGCKGGSCNTTKKFMIRDGQFPGQPNMMYFHNKGMSGECPMMDDSRMDVTITTDGKANPEIKSGTMTVKPFDMPLWQNAVNMMKGNDSNIKAFVDKVKAEPELLKKLKDALNK